MNRRKLWEYHLWEKVEAGKTTISTAFALYVKNYVKNVVLFDADINSHVGKSIGMDKIELGDRIEELRKIFWRK